MARSPSRLRLALWLLGALVLGSGCELRSQRRSATGQPQGGAYPPGAYPPGAYPPGAYPPGAYPPGSQPPGAYPPGSGPPGVTPTPPPPTAPPGSLVRWQALPPNNSNVNLTWGPTLTDIMQRKPPREKGQWDDVAGTGHELTHSISFELRLVASRSRPGNGFYVLGGQAAVMAEPGFRKAQVAGLVPPSLRQTRFALYMAGQAGWDSRPLYVWDEWNAYINGCTVAVERYQLGLEPHKTFATTDTVFAVLEFTIYALAVIHAAQQYEPAYLTQEPQAREFFAWNARRAMALVARGRNLPPFKWSELDLLETTLRSAPEVEPLRASARSIFGAAWTREVFGF